MASAALSTLSTRERPEATSIVWSFFITLSTAHFTTLVMVLLYGWSSKPIMDIYFSGKNRDLSRHTWQKCPQQRNTEWLQDIVDIIQPKKYSPYSSQSHSLNKRVSQSLLVVSGYVSLEKVIQGGGKGGEIWCVHPDISDTCLSSYHYNLKKKEKLLLLLINHNSDRT